MNTPHRSRRTLGRTIVRTLTANLVAVIVGIGAWAIIGGTATVTATGQPYPDAGLDRVQLLIERHHCWTGEQPADVEQPGHAVVTLPGGHARIMNADVGYGIWLYHEPGVLHAFCA